MAQAFSEMSRAERSLETVRNSKRYLGRFYNRGRDRKKGGQLAWCMAGVPPELLATFDVDWEWPENFGTLSAARLVAPKFIAVAEAEGYSGELCSYLTNSMGYARRCLELGEPPPESPLEGGMGQPTMLLGSGFLCDPRFKWFQAMATRYFKVPVFNSDPVSPPYDVNVDDPRVAAHYVGHLRRDLRAQIAFLEEQTGLRLDPAKLRRQLVASQKALAIWHEILQLRRARPCPMGAADYFSAIIPQLFMLGDEETITFYEAVLAEVKDRVARGVGVVSDERYRFMWGGLPPWFNLGLFNYLERLGAVVVVETSYLVGDPVELDLDDPVEALVQRTWKKACWQHHHRTEILPEVCNPAVFTAAGSDLLERWVGEFSLNGALLHRTRSCRAASVGQIHMRDVLRQAGIGTLILESDMADPRSWSDEKVKGQVEAFLESVDAAAR